MKFKVGDVCTVKDRHACGHFDNNNGRFIKITKGFEGYSSYYYDILDAHKNKVSNCFGCLEDCNLELVEEVETIINLKEKKMVKKDVGTVSFSRGKGEQILSIKISEEIANLFVTPLTPKSDVYKNKEGENLKYYQEKPILRECQTLFRQKEGEDITLERYGTNLMLSGNFNFSILRTVGIVQGIEVRVGELILEDQVVDWMKNLSLFVKFLQKNYIAQIEIKATITIEM